MDKRNGDLPANRDELVEEWGRYFEELLNNSIDLLDTSNIPETPQGLNINISNFTKEQLITAIKSMKNNKSPGGDSLHSPILEITNAVLNRKNFKTMA